MAIDKKKYRTDHFQRRIDAHQHFWKFDPARDSWITDEMSMIRKDFLPADIGPLLKQNGFDGTVAVQADQSEAETRFLLQLAADHSFIKGVVGWIDLCDQSIQYKLSDYKDFHLLKGFRHILQGEKDRAFMLRPEFTRGIAALSGLGFTYDILVYTDQLESTLQFIQKFPDQKFVIDHLAKPNIRQGEKDHWEKYMRAIAVHQNVYCKISGMVTEADWKHWKQENFSPYLDTVVEAFGIDRIMFGSDWPVCLVAATYNQVVAIAQEYFSSFTENEQQKFFGGNAIEFYNLN